MACHLELYKTPTLAKGLAAVYENYCYLNFDIEADREVILQGESAVLEKCHFNQVRTELPLLVLDEFHKYKHWKNFLKGFYDKY